MSFEEKRQESRPATGEAPFRLSEVFFSRTDERGVIQAGNYIFRRVAGFDWDEMLRAPHKIIRHPDMPKAVFWLLWDTIKRGEAIGAYVKNLAKDGLYYWVYASVMPFEGGYASVRIKPTSALFKTVQAEYATLLKAEKEQGVSPEESAKTLLKRLQDLGFDDYAHFSAHSLSEELISRDLGLEKPPDKSINRLKIAAKDARGLASETLGLIDEFATMQTIPHNMRVIASRLEPTGGPVSTLSQNYGSMSQEISDWFDKNVVGEDSNFSQISTRVTQSMFLECLARVLSEATVQLEREKRRLGDADLETERQHLRGLEAEYLELSKKELQRVNEEALKISTACRIMHRQILGLSTTRVMCKIEGARMNGEGESLDDIITQLDAFQTKVNARLERITNLAAALQIG